MAGHFPDFVLLGVLTCAVWTDMRRRRIPNPLILIGLVMALALAVAVGGVRGGLAALGGGLIGLLVFLPFFALRLVGAGDTKLFAVVGVFTGAGALLPITLFTCIAGGVLGIFVLVRDRSLRTMWSNLKLVLNTGWMSLMGSGVALGDLELKSAARLPYAVAILAGVVWWMVTR
jgi:prepilin peptidase CpaA